MDTALAPQRGRVTGRHPVPFSLWPFSLGLLLLGVACDGNTHDDDGGIGQSESLLSCETPCDCERNAAPFESVRSETLFLLDRSTTMNKSFDKACTNQVTGEPGYCIDGQRWKTLDASLRSLAEPVSELGIDTAVMTFPDQTRTSAQGGCAVAPTPQVQFGSTYSAALNYVGETTQHAGFEGDTNGPHGVTPMQEAVKSAIAYLQNRPDDIPPVLILGTDGLPDCGNQTIAGTEDAIRQARETHGIFTAVIGIALEGESHEGLNTLAMAGGLAQEGDTKYLEASSATKLSESLHKATLSSSLCRRKIDEAQADEQIFRVRIDGEVVPRSTENGWDYASDKLSINFHGASCDRLLERPSAEVLLATRPDSCGTVRLE